MKVLVTGADGFIGSELIQVLRQRRHDVVAVARKAKPGFVAVGDLSGSIDWTDLLIGCDVVVHLAARVHQMGDRLNPPWAEYRRINTEATMHLARQAEQGGVGRFIFMSTVKVLGEECDRAYVESNTPAPSDTYGVTKWEAEQILLRIAAETRMEVVILRPPLVYGPGVKGNLLRLMQAIDKFRPLPLGAIQNQRSLIYLGNLVDAIQLCLTQPKAAGKTFLVSDGNDVSTPELVRRIAAALGHRPFLFPVPVSWMRWAGRVLGIQTAIDRLLGSLCVDISPLREELGWTPPYTMQEGLEATAQWYRETKKVV